jgi:thiol-disulfide isomerase/thioredoxin
MRFSKVVVLLVLCFLLASFAAPAQKPTSRAAKPKPKIAPKAVVSPIGFEQLKGLLNESRQRPLLINFWATWCDPCREEFPDLVKIDTEYRPKTLDFVTVSLDDATDIKTTVPQFLDSMKATMPAYLLKDSDPEPAINLLDPHWQGNLPATFLFNAQGEVVFKHVGRVDAKELRAAIDKLVARKSDE